MLSIGTKINDLERCIQGLHKVVPAIISETGKAMDFKFGRNIHSPLKILEKRECGCTFLSTPYYLRNGQSYGLHSADARQKKLW